MPDEAASAEPAEPPSTSPPSTSTPSTSAPRTLVVPARFCGPPRSANGGYVASRVASYVGVTSAADTAPHGIEPRAVTTVLRAPVPLDTALAVTGDEEHVTLQLGDRLIAEATPGQLDADPPEPVPYTDAVALGEHYTGHARHPMPTCFGCGTEREPGDGLRLAIGAVGDGRVGGAWQPDRSLLPAGADSDAVAAEFAWTALDCTAAWAWDFADEPALLGTMTGIVDEAPYVGDRCVVVGSVVERSGRKIHTASALYDADGRVLGRAQSVWITVDASRFAP